ncbi:MAG: cell division protein [Burkholderiales bacterium]|jgi:cell division protein FtsI (penicillin-binding protein 3)|nr:cell division protein [Burkholderiales bacterium]
MLANQQIRKFYSLAENMGSYTQIRSADKAQHTFSRSRGILIFAIVLTTAILGRLIYLNTVSNHFLENQLNTRISRVVKIPAMRGVITDRNNNPLAVSTPVASVWVDPTELDNLTNDQVNKLATVLNMTVAELNAKLNQKDKTFVYIKRAISPEQAKLVDDMQIDGIYNIQEFKRYYPSGEVAAHVVGFNNIDDRGSEGIEYANDKNLLGHDGVQQILRDRQGRVIENTGTARPATNGDTITLSIDNRIQYVAYNALKNQVEKTHAKGGSAVVLDAKTGEVLSMVNYPTYNPNNREKATLDMIRNRAAIDLYEPGSTMKPLVVAKALDLGIVTPDTVFNTIPYSVSGHLIKDVHTSPRMTVSQIIIKSSDVGVSKIAFKMTPQTFWTYDREVGFGQKVGTHFPGEAKGIFKSSWKDLRPLDVASMSYGYAVSVSLMQMARAYTLFTNNGCMLPISFYKIDSNITPTCKQIVKPKAAEQVRDMLSKVTEDGAGGTGRLAQVEGYTTAGKTGTAHKNRGKAGYLANSYVGSFVGYAPATNPRLVIAVMIDEPRGQYFGGVVAAPVFSDIAGPSLHILGVKQDK